MRPVANGFMTFPGRAKFAPESFWPLPEDGLLPDLETTEAVERALDDDKDPDQAIAEVLAAAEHEGVVPEALDIEAEPWAALLSLEVERLRASRQDSSNDIVLNLADDIVDALPNHPAADFARLYQLDQMARSQRTQHEAWDLALDVIRQTDDTFVVLQAIDLLTSLPRNLPLESTDLDRILAQWDQADPALDPIDVSAFGVDGAFRLNDRKRAQEWVERFEEATHQFCTQDSPSTPRCALYQDNLDAAVAVLGERDVRDADTLAQALEIAAYQCANAGHAIDRIPYRVTALWNEGAWTWDPWTCVEGLHSETRYPREARCTQTGYTDCIENTMLQAPSPEETPHQLRFNVVR